MPDTRIILAGLWVATMLTYLWGDVLRIMAGHVKPGEIKGAKATQCADHPVCMAVGNLEA